MDSQQHNFIFPDDSLDTRKNQPETSVGIEYETIKDLAKRTKMPVSWWYGQTRKRGVGAVPRIKKGKYILFVPYEVDAWLGNQAN